MTHDLSALAWTVMGWRPFAWQIGRSMETGVATRFDIPELPARVPGSVQSALRAAGWLPDWNVGLNSLQCEWVEHRHWEFAVEIPAGWIQAGQPAVLRAEGLDYSGWILVDGREAATFRGTLKRHAFDLSSQLGDGRAHRLAIVFDATPEEQGQIGFTVQSKFLKPRNNFGWDFCPRFVPVGIWDRLTLEAGPQPVSVVRAFSDLDESRVRGRAGVVVECTVEGIAAILELSGEGAVVATASVPLVAGSQTLAVEIENPDPWWPNGEGPQALYDLTLRVPGREDAHFRVGFKHVRWLPCQDAPGGALPWICEINGQAIFLQGVNWVAPQLDFHDVPDARYAERIALYREMGCNVIRVWGGSFLEKQIFYDLCDEAGLFVWQDFPLSSSGIDNWPPEDPAVIAELADIARDYIRRRGHHACKLLWCGGNELHRDWGTGGAVPVDESHPCIAAFARVAVEEDPGTRFVPATSSGPQFYASEENFGKGMHHDVHGPWNSDDLEQWKSYWSRDDALLRSETGMPGAASVELIRKYCGDRNPWPPTRDNPYHLHANSWWIQWDLFRSQLEGLDPGAGLEKYVALSQKFQAEALAVAVRTCRDRFPRCGGIMIWMGHDVFPCPINTSIIDFDGRPKPAYFARKEILMEGHSAAR